MRAANVADKGRKMSQCLTPKNSAVAFQVVIPARYASTRLPGKPLIDLAGKPMVVRVAERALAAGAAGVRVATDHDEVAAVCRRHGIAVNITRSDHATGTDRLAEVVMQEGWGDDTVVVNVQGDEPLIAPENIALVAARLCQSQAAIATLAHPIKQRDDFFNPNVVKVVANQEGEALYFSRAPIPWARDHFAQEEHRLPDGFPALHHIGLYAYRAGFLREFNQLSASPLEQFECLEQLRALWHGKGIVLSVVENAPAKGVDTPADAAEVAALIAELEAGAGWFF